MPGGTRHYELAQLLRSASWDTTVFASPLNYATATFQRPVSLRRAVMRRDEGGLDVHWVYTVPYRGNNWRRYLNMLSFPVVAAVPLLRGLRPDAVIGSSPNPFAALAGWLAAWWHRTPFVLEVRDLWPETLIEMGVRNPAIILPLRVIERWLYARAVAIVALTEGIEERLVAKGVPEAKVHLIPNAPLRPAPPDAARRAARRHGLGWGSRVVAIYAGAHGPANGLETVVDAARQLADLPDLLVVLIGDGGAKAELQMRAADLTNVEFLDPVPKDQIGDILRAADIAILSLRGKDLFQGARPNKLFDYMVAGLPIVSTVGGEAWGLIDAAESGVLAHPDDAGALAHALRGLAEDRACRLRLGERGFRYVAEHHSRERTAEDLGALLAVIAGRAEPTHMGVPWPPFRRSARP